MSIAEKLTTIAENEHRVYAAGKDAEQAEFWRVYQSNGDRANYNYAFYGSYWNDDTFNPKHNFKPTGLNSTFRSCAVTDLVEKFESVGAAFDTSKCTNFQYTFYSSDITRLPVISTVSCTSLTDTFAMMASLESIETLILKDDGSQSFTDTFVQSKLKEIRIEGVFGKSVSFSSCTALSAESAISVILHLKNYAGTSNDGTYSLKLHANAWTAVNAHSTAPDGGTWKNYVMSLGWTT